MTPRILVIGNAGMGLTLNMRGLPAPGEIITEEQYRYTPTGKGANMAVALSRLGADCVFCAKLGADSNGRLLSRFYERSGIDTRFITSDREERTALTVRICDGGSLAPRTVNYRGACERLTPDETETALTSMPDAMIIQLGIPGEAAMSAMRIAARRGVPIFADASEPRLDFPLERLPRMAVFATNEEGAQRLTGITPAGVQSCLKVCMTLEKRVRAMYYVLKLGRRGMFLYDGTYQKLLGAYEVEVADPAAAGDVFMAAMTLSYVRSVVRELPDMEHACVYANLAAALAVSKPEAAVSSPTAEEVAEFVRVNRIPVTLAEDEA